MRIKKFLGILAASVMVLGMSVSTYATDPVALPVSNSKIEYSKLPELSSSEKRVTFTMNGADKDTMDAYIQDLHEYYEDVIFYVDYDTHTVEVYKMKNDDSKPSSSKCERSYGGHRHHNHHDCR